MYTVEINDAGVDRVFAELESRLSDMTEVFNVLGDLLEDRTEKRFEAGVAPDGTRWAPKSQATIDAYVRRGQTADPRPLFGPNADTLPLRRSFFRDAGPRRLEIGTNKIQAAVMQYGARKGAFGQTATGRPIPWGDIPARPFLGISAEDRDLIIITAEEWLEEAGED
ncbi:phage virion morphogenesis protein [Roseobacter sp. S98]|uniref:phage virion morphogenesis protein n=1 Tax=Roseobacter algicola (ex Choi et al. 2025) (nom. illeg.) TaxID=3092138 RepID=UPI003F511E84